MFDAGNVNATVMGETHYLFFYSGEAPDTSVLVSVLPAPSAGADAGASLPGQVKSKAEWSEVRLARKAPASTCPGHRRIGFQRANRPSSR